MLFTRKSERRENPAPEPTAQSAYAPGSTRDNRPCQHPAVTADRRHSDSNRATTQSFIDGSLTIVGDLCSDGDVQIDGRICGNVTCAQLIVGTDAAITGAVSADQAIVRGSITGTIRAAVVILQETARVKSDIAYTLLAIDDGATFEGAVRRCAKPREENDSASPLAELERTIAMAGAATTATPEDAGDPGGGPAPEVASPQQRRRNANGHADAQR
jgi:cytoskeletal protein CcmA (bactofilin family)